MEFVSKYSEWVRKNPTFAGELETISKLVSLIVPNRLPNSVLFSELFYSLSNLLILWNNQILRKSLNSLIRNSPDTQEKWRVFFSILDYASAFFEIGAKQLWGEKGRWIVITIIQLLKTIWRLALLVKNQTGLAETRPIKILSKTQISEQQQVPSDNFMTLSSGRVVRKVSSANSEKGETPPSRLVGEGFVPTKLTGRYLVAEIFDAVKPMAYLGAAAVFGSKSWSPWLTSLMMDSASLLCYSDIRSLKDDEKAELFRRRLQLLLYLLRSPLYDRFTKDKIAAILLILSEKVPLLRHICLPLLKYIPVYQKLYFYTWL